jgi:glycine cleavage system transcriptional repressor
MPKVIISVIGRDRPGIIAAVTGILFEADCNIENVSQTIVQSEFSGIFIASIPGNLLEPELARRLQQGLAAMDLHVFLKPLESVPETGIPSVKSEPFVITTRGPDKKGLVARITRVIADHNVNVTNLQAVFKGGKDPGNNIMIYEVDVPFSCDQKALRRDLRNKAGQLDLVISIQHKRIFEAINRI